MTPTVPPATAAAISFTVGAVINVVRDVSTHPTPAAPPPPTAPATDAEAAAVRHSAVPDMSAEAPTWPRRNSATASAAGVSTCALAAADSSSNVAVASAGAMGGRNAIIRGGVAAAGAGRQGATAPRGCRGKQPPQPPQPP